MINVEAHDRPLRELAVRNFHEKILSRCLDALAMRLSTWEPKIWNTLATSMKPHGRAIDLLKEQLEKRLHYPWTRGGYPEVKRGAHKTLRDLLRPIAKRYHL